MSLAPHRSGRVSDFITLFMKSALRSILTLVAACALSPVASAQARAELDVDIYVGLSITGAVGTVCSIEYRWASYRW